jgi:pimeloyl-ACP methyl ester carboxylesterase
VGEVDIHYEIHGDPGPVRPAGGATVLLLHRLGSSGLDWPLQLPAFTACARVITVDLRGHGRSSGAGWPTIEKLADDLAGLLRALAESAAHVVGLSQGGRVGLALAIRSPAQV